MGMIEMSCRDPKEDEFPIRMGIEYNFMTYEPGMMDFAYDFEPMLKEDAYTVYGPLNGHDVDTLEARKRVQVEWGDLINAGKFRQGMGFASYAHHLRVNLLIYNMDEYKRAKDEMFRIAECMTIEERIEL